MLSSGTHQACHVSSRCLATQHTTNPHNLLVLHFVVGDHLFLLTLFVLFSNIFLFLVARWATIPLMYVLVRCFREVAVGYITIFFLNLFVGLNTTACSFLLRLFAGHGPVSTPLPLGADSGARASPHPHPDQITPAPDIVPGFRFPS